MQSGIGAQDAIHGVDALFAADLDGDGDLDLVAASDEDDDSIVWFKSLLRESERRVGDVNEDGRFDRLDLVAILATGKYLSGQPATWAEGDFNQDGVFDQLDVIYALEFGDYSA